MKLLMLILLVLCLAPLATLVGCAAATTDDPTATDESTLRFPPRRDAGSSPCDGVTCADGHHCVAVRAPGMHPLLGAVDDTTADALRGTCVPDGPGAPGDACGAGHECGTNLLCCYPCGVEGCESRCIAKARGNRCPLIP